MEETHVFRLESAWCGGTEGEGRMAFGDGCLVYGRPSELGGQPGRSNPEEMLLGAVVSCYTITLAMLLERRKLEGLNIEVAGEMDAVRQPDRTLKITAIRLKPVIRAEGLSEENAKTALIMAEKADKYCLVSAALRGNVEVTVDPRVG